MKPNLRRFNIAFLFTAMLLLCATAMVVLITVGIAEENNTASFNVKENPKRKGNEPVNDIFFLLTFKDAETLLKKMGWISSTKIPLESQTTPSSVVVDDAEIKNPTVVKYRWLVPHPASSVSFAAGTHSVYYKVKYPEKAYRINIKTNNKQTIEPHCFLTPVTMTIVNKPDEANHGITLKESTVKSYFVLPVQKVIELNFKDSASKLYYTHHYILVLFEKK